MNEKEQSAPGKKSAQTALPLRLKLLYSIGDLSTSTPLTIVSFYQLFFLTDVVGLDPALAGWSVIAGRIWDALNDPLFGLISDRIRSRWGRRRVLLLTGAIPLGVAFVMMWLVPPFSPLGLTIYYALTFILFDTAYTAVHVGYNALTPELTTDYDERSSLNGVRMVFSIVGALGAIILMTVLGWILTDIRLRFLIVGIVLGLVITVPPLVVFRVTEGHTLDAPEENLPLLESVRMTVSNRPFLMVIAIYLLSWTAASILASVLVYYASYYLLVPDQADYFVLAAYACAIGFIPLSVWLSRKLDKRMSFIIGSGTWAVVLVGIFVLPSDQIGLAYVLACLSGLGIATAYVIPWSMLPDVIEHDQLRTGQRREGAYYAMAALFQKLGTGAALWGMAQVLASNNYISADSTAGVIVQPPEAVLAIRFFGGPVPAVLLLAAILFAWKYPITRATHLRHLEELAQR